MDRSVSWWDCGEFITTSYTLGVGHPPGAPFYQLVAHCVMLLSFGNPLLVAPLSNALSAICGGFTVGLLYWTLCEFHSGAPSTSYRLGAAVGALCYLFCDTAWFSAVESEVYAMAMLLCSLCVWATARWMRTSNARLLLLAALALGLGVCVHLMVLLVAPAMLLMLVAGKVHWRQVALMVPFFLLGLSPYAVVPIRAAANPPVNEGNPASAEAFVSYVRRDQYAKAPLYPRMWRERDSANHDYWSLGFDGVAGNAVYYVNYQLGYMYGRYLMYNFIGRENLKHRCVALFIIPMLLAVAGLFAMRRRRRQAYRVVMLLFLFGGPLLNLYLNHPCYEPRERDYAYVLSFYAVAMWVGAGAAWSFDRMCNAPALQRRRVLQWGAAALVWLAPLSMVLGNWSDHDRHRCHSVHDIAMAHLQSCDNDAILITFGDNDTFPLWYLQHVERQRTDISVHNVNLEGFAAIRRLLAANAGRRPVYVSQYFYDRFGDSYEGLLRCEGFCWRLLPDGVGVDDTGPLGRHVADSIEWHITPGEYTDPVSASFLAVWEANVASVAEQRREH